MADTDTQHNDRNNAVRITITPIAGPPTSWLRLFFGYSLITAILILALALFVPYLKNRPTNLRNPARQVASFLEDELKKYIPAENIHKGPPELRENEDASWSWLYYKFDVDLPTTINAQGLVILLRKDLLRNAVRLVEKESTTPKNTWSLILAEYEIATITFNKNLTKKIIKDDLRTEAFRTAQQVDKALQAIGAQPETLLQKEVTQREDNEAIWTITRFYPTFQNPLSAGELKATLENKLSKHDLQINTNRTSENKITLQITYNNRPYIEIALGSAPPPKTDTQYQPPQQATTKKPDEDIAPTQTPTTTAKIAIILDDGGYGGDALEAVLKLNPKITLAILPNTPFALETAQRGTNNGFEIMLHMPMQTHRTDLVPIHGQLSEDLTRADIQQRTIDALNQIPGVVGVNNHEGSKFASNPELMRSFLQVLQQKSLYFIDSLTSGDSQGYETAQALSIPTAQRDIFLDNERNENYIRGQLDALIQLALQKGKAIGIGHFRLETAKVLAEEIPNLAKQGIQLVHAAELVQ